MLLSQTLAMCCLKGVEIAEVFQGTPRDFAARMVFTAPYSGNYVIEVRTLFSPARNVFSEGTYFCMSTVSYDLYSFKYWLES